MEKPATLYHGSAHRIDGPLSPILIQGGADQQHTRSAVFATAREDLAALFMFPFKNTSGVGVLASIGFERNIPYICVWGTREEFSVKDHGGYVYVLPSDTFEKVGKDYEWQSFVPVAPLEVKHFESVIDGMMQNGVQVYFINDDPMFDRVVAEKDNRAPFLKDLISENQKSNINVRSF